jgi:hypothetical protein
MKKGNRFQHREHGDTENTEKILFGFLRVLCVSVYSVSKALGFQP